MIDLRYQKAQRSPEELIKHLNSFKVNPKFSVGIWYFSPGGGRFHDRFVPAMSIEERINLLAEMKHLGIDGVEAHYPGEINEDNSGPFGSANICKTRSLYNLAKIFFSESFFAIFSRVL